MVEQSRIAKSRRSYRLVARSAAMDRTRERITLAAQELHGTVGPAATTMSAVAERAGVTRATLYRHFATEEALFTACSSHWLAENPAPDLGRWAAIEDPVGRLRLALNELYGYYRSTERMMANLLRDIAALPASLQAPLAAMPSAILAILAPGWPDGGAAQLRRAALGHAVAFETWRSLSGQGLSDAAAADLMVRLVSCVGTEESGGPVALSS
jgi:AcrR family transcriptional regulator